MLERLRQAILWSGAGLGALCLAWAATIHVLGLTPLVFTSGSMGPQIAAGDLALAESAPARAVAVGDVVSVVNAAGVRVTHRVVEIDPVDTTTAVLTLRGDANASPDAEAYTVTRVERVVTSVPAAGHVVDAVSSPSGRFVSGAWFGLCLFLVLGAGREGAGAARTRRGDHPGGRHRRQDRSRARGGGVGVGLGAGVAATLLGLGLVHVIPTLVTPTSAAFEDRDATLSSGALAAFTVTKPAAIGCTVSNPLLGTKSLTTTWTAAPGLTYTAVIRETGTSLVVTSSGTERSVTVTGGLLGSLLGSAFNIDVTATLPGSGWTASSTRAGSFAALGLGFTCGAWT